MFLNVATVLLVASYDVGAKGVLSRETPVVEHQKEAGNGYLPGSPHYEKQEELKKAAGSKSEGVPPVSTTMKCIINLTIQYFVLYTAVAIVSTYNQVNGFLPGTVANTLQAATATVNFAPMLSVLFLGTRMRALQLSGGDPDAYDLPQPYVKMSMQFCAWGILGQTIMVLVLPLVQRGPGVLDSSSGGVLGTVIAVTRWVLMALVYGGFTAVCVGAFSMEAPADLWEEGTAPPVSPAVACTMNLSLQFFAVYLAIAAVQTYEQFSGRSEESMKLANVLQLAANTVNFAPMLCILFIGARMRALQIDPKFGNPQLWAQRCFYLCAYSVLVQLLLVFLVPYLLGGRCVKGASDGDISFELPGSSTGFWILSGVRYAMMLALYGGFTAVIVSVFTIEAEDPKDTPPVSPAMMCVMNLTVQFFFVYLLLWVLITMKQLSLEWSMGGRTYDSFFTTAIATMEAAKATVQFCPMLAILFIGMRMRALQLSDNKGAPQRWAQDGMYLSTYAVMLQVCMVFLSPLLFGTPKTDEYGALVNKPSNPILGYVVVTIRYLGMLCLYGGAITLVVALFLITPETATGRGSSLVPGVEVPQPPAVAPA